LCSICFTKQAARSGARSAGNSDGNPGNAGNSKAKGNPGNAGNSKGNPDNAGNQVRGVSKKRAGKRSGLRRCAPVALVIKERWLSKILSHDKKWEIRGTATARRGRIHLAQPGGLLVGSASISGCTRIRREDFLKHQDKHCVPSLSMVTYPHIWAWHLESVQKYKKPFPYDHNRGAIIWVYPKPKP